MLGIANSWFEVKGEKGQYVRGREEVLREWHNGRAFGGGVVRLPCGERGSGHSRVGQGAGVGVAVAEHPDQEPLGVAQDGTVHFPAHLCIP